mmetsp:Transcript_9934/g.60674  ORF Transcript_9934/g.60674 Transcript_9934/m.60674 type:complete len:207 (-) Transcript_9934:59-679(-)
MNSPLPSANSPSPTKLPIPIMLPVPSKVTDPKDLNSPLQVPLPMNLNRPSPVPTPRNWPGPTYVILVPSNLPDPVNVPSGNETVPTLSRVRIVPSPENVAPSPTVSKVPLPEQFPVPRNVPSPLNSPSPSKVPSSARNWPVPSKIPAPWNVPSPVHVPSLPTVNVPWPDSVLGSWAWPKAAMAATAASAHILLNPAMLASLLLLLR